MEEILEFCIFGFFPKNFPEKKMKAEVIKICLLFWDFSLIFQINEKN